MAVFCARRVGGPVFPHRATDYPSVGRTGTFHFFPVQEHPPAGSSEAQRSASSRASGCWAHVNQQEITNHKAEDTDVTTREHTRLSYSQAEPPFPVLGWGVECTDVGSTQPNVEPGRRRRPT